MNEVIYFNILCTLTVIIFAIVSYIFIDKRYRKRQGSEIPKGFERTDEVTIDPKDGKRIRVYFNSQTGERFYHEEK